MASLDEVLAKLSKTTIASILLVGGVIFIVLSDPPHTVCDSQMEAFKKSQIGFLTKDPDNKAEKDPLFSRLLAQCKIANSPGGCYELFLQMRKMMEKSKAISLECNDELGTYPQFKQSILGVAELIMQLAWGEQPPESYYEKFGWLDTADISLYCNLKERAIATLDGPAWNAFVDKSMLALPGAENLQRDKVWSNSIASVNCGRYP